MSTVIPTISLFPRHFIAIVFLLFWGMLLQAQSHDFCQWAKTLQCGDQIQDNTIGATPDIARVCSFSHNSPGVWYTFIGANTYVTLSTCGAGTDFDTRLTVYEGDCGNLTCKIWNDDATNCGGTASEVTFIAQAGLQYFILINGKNGDFGNFELNMQCSAPMASNDHCTGAITLNCGNTLSGSLSNATPDQQSSCTLPITGRALWYYFEGNGAPVTLSTCSPQTNFDTRITVLKGTCGSFNCEAVNDDACGTASELTFLSRPNTKYFIAVHAAPGVYGDFELSLTCPPPPVNDQPCNAIPLQYGMNPMDNRNARKDPLEVCPGPGSGSSCRAQDGWCSFNTRVECSVWYTFIAPPSGTINLLAEGFDTQVALYQVNNCLDYSTFKRISANDDSGNLIDPTADFSASGLIETSCLVPGQTYYVQVDGFNGDQGPGRITLSDVGTAPLQLDAGQCQNRMIGYLPVERDTNFLVADVVGGRPPYHFEWQADPSILFFSADSSKIAVQPYTTTTYYCTVKDARGCKQTAQVKVEVTDLRCLTGFRGPNSRGIKMCYTPLLGPSRPVCIPYNDVAALLRQQGYSLGSCNPQCTATNPSFPPAPTCKQMDISLLTDGLGVDVAWELRNTTTGAYIAGTNYNTLNGFTQYAYTYCLDPTQCYAFTISDRIGDGICCTFGSGSYSINFDGITYTSPSGGAFGNSETIMIGNCHLRNAGKQASPTDRVASPEAKITAFPNPFSDQATLRVEIPETAHSQIDLLDAGGRKVCTLFSGSLEANTPREIPVDGTRLPAGLYFYQLKTTTGIVQSGKWVVQP